MYYSRIKQELKTIWRWADGLVKPSPDILHISQNISRNKKGNHDSYRTVKVDNLCFYYI